MFVKYFINDNKLVLKISKSNKFVNFFIYVSFKCKGFFYF